MVHRKCYFLPAGWIKEVVVSNISSKPSIYGSCCISYSASRDRQHALTEEVCLVVLASSLMHRYCSTKLSHSCRFFSISSTVSVKTTTTRIVDFDENLHVYVKKQYKQKVVIRLPIRLVTVDWKSNNRTTFNYITPESTLNHIAC